MNIQAMMKQAQKMQKELLSKQAEIEKMEFESNQGFVTVKMNGKKEVTDVKINLDADFNNIMYSFFKFSQSESSINDIFLLEFDISL